MKRENFILEELKLGQKITLFGDDYTVSFNIHCVNYPCGYFLMAGGYDDNGKMFKVIGKEGEHESFVKGVLGYYAPEGAFPYCKSLSDLTKLVNAFIQEYNIKNFDPFVADPEPGNCTEIVCFVTREDVAKVYEMVCRDW